jgi:hypothetical protein
MPEKSKGRMTPEEAGGRKPGEKIEKGTEQQQPGYGDLGQQKSGQPGGGGSQQDREHRSGEGGGGKQGGGNRNE